MRILLNERFPQKLGGGLALLILGLIVLVFNVRDAPPALHQLAQEEAQVTGRLTVIRGIPGKGGRSAYLVVPLGHARAEVHHDCNTSGCKIPPRLFELRQGAKVRVWLSGAVIWQLQQEDELLLDYADVRAVHQHGRFAFIGLAILMIAAGGTLIYWSFLPEPVQQAFFDR